MSILQKVQFAKVQGDRKALPLKALSKVLHFAGARAETIV